MPELPEVETIARTLAPRVFGRRVSGLRVLLPKSFQDPEHLAACLEGAGIGAVWRRAKLLMIPLYPAASARDPEPAALVMAFHLKMTGSFFVHPQGTPPLRHTRLVFDLDNGERLFFDDIRTFGWGRLMRADALGAWPFWASLGPEPLEPAAAALGSALATRLKDSRRAIKAALLDQTVVAGVGNIYADEALFAAGLDPSTPAGQISGAGYQALAGSLQGILRQAIRECGSSIRNYRDAGGNAGAFQNAFAVYGRAGQPCIRCGMPLESRQIAGRTTVWCSLCQGNR
ncbi:bifunctional DNA-formamidopyrimidine glycosylase/DNA-(apurinic or apyrimidinic site) lyase [Phaeovibrio sulfidiphilus]|uniref:Formamidopyrimidine-DNA glycosylase n=1 Tax=Phaeovibrio sulfidiphilus TaxID=1220600 RepID=A0A8J7CQM9_9PROT|nr:bifunctional DNA-formamidopyrimidine glycosylase/DNA-(apurinic or apyrimidinic site) lyase [Phaeovibrio sulfidiphilus]MBE1237005.1 bifunctional DNA-formamidopyrimidine glycosylase/DNA-(apurinic or apyrimidinic site) lyase [Phaeovibrio sulfidiphilus]